MLFFRSTQGLIFLAALAVALIGYFLIAAVERRQEAAELESPRAALESLAVETNATRRDLEELVGAVGDYGRHLQSHTQILRSMSTASQDLAAVTEQLSRAVSTLRQPTPPPSLLTYLSDQAYAEWSLVVPEQVAAALDQTPSKVLSDLTRLAIFGRIEVRAVDPPDLYRYRIRPETASG